MESTSTFIGIQELVQRTGVPAAWLRREARAHRLPHLRAGRRLLFDAEAVERALTERARHGTKEGDDRRAPVG